MNITVLDGYTLNPGDLSWDELQRVGSCTVYDRTSADEILTRCADADIVLTNKVPVSAETIARLPKLKYIGVLATGYNIVDVAAANAKGIVVTNVPAYSTMSVAQLTFALLLELTHHAGHHSEKVHTGEWQRRIDFSFSDFPLVELAGKTMGIIGFGNIGQSVAKIATALGLQVAVFTRTPEKYQRWLTDPVYRVSFVALEEVFRSGDVVSLHCPLTPSTERIVNEQYLMMMKKKSFLINTSRGGLVDEAALADALNSGIIAGAGLDVLSTEPPKPDNPLLTAKNCIITPHIAWASFEARQRLMRSVAENIQAFINGNPINRIQP